MIGLALMMLLVYALAFAWVAVRLRTTGGPFRLALATIVALVGIPGITYVHPQLAELFPRPALIVSLAAMLGPPVLAAALAAELLTRRGTALDDRQVLTMLLAAYLLLLGVGAGGWVLWQLAPAHMENAL